MVEIQHPSPYNMICQDTRRRRVHDVDINLEEINMLDNIHTKVKRTIVY